MEAGEDDPTRRWTGTSERLAEAARAAGSPAVLHSSSPLVHTAGALVVLVGAVVLSVCRPRRLTRYGWRVQRTTRSPRP